MGYTNRMWTDCLSALCLWTVYVILGPKNNILISKKSACSPSFHLWISWKVDARAERHARGDEEAGGGPSRLCRSFVRSSTASFARQNRRACSQANPSASVVTAHMKSLTKMGYRTNYLWLVLYIGKLILFPLTFNANLNIDCLPGGLFSKGPETVPARKQILKSKPVE